MSLSDSVDVELADETEDSDGVTGGLELSSVLVTDCTGEDDNT